MLNYLKNLFFKKKIKNFSTTLTDSTVGTDSRKELSDKVKKIIKRTKKIDKIDNEDLNTLSEFYFNTQPIKPGIYNLNKSFSDGMCFDISGVHTVYKSNGDVDNIYINLREVTFSNDIVITVSVKDFHETFKFFDLKPVTSKE